MTRDEWMGGLASLSFYFSGFSGCDLAFLSDVALNFGYDFELCVWREWWG
jgi:hypothetical protein